MLISASTNIGSRCVNADAYDGSIFTEHSAERTSYFAVCDGVGEQIGRVASQRAIAGLRAAWEELSDLDRQTLPLQEIAVRLALCGREALCDIRLATTLALVVVRGSAYAALNVGDSPIFLRRGGETRELSVRDNNYFWKKSLGIEHPPESDADILREDLATSQRERLHIREGELVPGDTLLLCSDGVVGVGFPAWEASAEAMVRTAAERDPRADNCTAIMLRCPEA